MSQDLPQPYPSTRTMPELDQVAADVLRTAGDAIVVLDPHGHVCFWNDGACELFGWTAQEMLGRPATVLVPPDRADEVERIFRALAGAPEPAAVETVRLHRSGAARPVSCRVSPLTDPSGRIYGLSAIVRDNSREMELRSQLEQSRREAEARFTDSLLPQVSIDVTGRVAAINAAAWRLGGWATAKEVLGRPASEFLEPEEQLEAERRLARVLSGEVERSEHVHRIRRADGRYVEVKATSFAVRNDDGCITGIEVALEDVSTELAVQRALEANEERWRLLAVHSADVALLCDEAGVIRFVSAAVGRQFGYGTDSLVGTNGFSYLHPDDEPRARQLWAQAVATPGQLFALEGRILGADQQWRWVEQIVTSRLDVPGVESVVVNIIDISARRRAEDRLRESTDRDPLTGAATRARLMAALQAPAGTGANATHVGVLVLDLDRFKLVNSTHGEKAGDAALVATAGRLREATFDGELVARLGGDRFAVLLRDVEGTPALSVRTHELVAAIAKPTEVDGIEVKLTASAGAAFGPSGDPRELLHSAETALEEAKADMQHPVRVVAGGAASGAMARAALIDDLKRGLHADELVVRYQPVLNLTDGRVAAAEALVRWQHPDRGLLAPDAFIDAAEDSGLIVDVGIKVLQQACTAAARWAHLGTVTDPFHVAVNLSARQLTTAGAVELIRDCLQGAGADPRNLMIEVTESAVMSDVDTASAILQQLRDLGIAIAVDDFGTGYSSLTYVKRFPVTALKIDRSFVSGLGHDDDDAAIVASVVSLARAVRMDCIAEGVETHTQRTALQALGCGYAQGFLWSPAVEPAAFEDWIRGHDAATVLDRSAEPVDVMRRPSKADAARAAASPGVLARIAALQSQGASLYSIAGALNAEQLLTPSGKRWHPRSVAQLIAGQPLPQPRTDPRPGRKDPGMFTPSWSGRA